MLSIIIPAYNEEKRIIPTLKSYYEFFKSMKKELAFEILVIVNGSTDKTFQISQDYAKMKKEIKVFNLKKGAKGYAIIEGIKKSNGTIVGFVDADMSTTPQEFLKLFKELANYDGVIASRWVPGSRTRRKVGKYIRSKGFNFLVRSLLFLSYQDTQCGAKIFRKEKINFINELVSMKWAFDIDFLYLSKKNKLVIKEIPTNWIDKEGSKTSFRTTLQMAIGLLRLRIFYSPFRRLLKVYDLLPKKLKVHI